MIHVVQEHDPRDHVVLCAFSLIFREIMQIFQETKILLNLRQLRTKQIYPYRILTATSLLNVNSIAYAYALYVMLS